MIFNFIILLILPLLFLIDSLYLILLIKIDIFLL